MSIKNNIKKVMSPFVYVKSARIKRERERGLARS